VEREEQGEFSGLVLKSLSASRLTLNTFVFFSLLDMELHGIMRLINFSFVFNFLYCRYSSAFYPGVLPKPTKTIFQRVAFSVQGMEEQQTTNSTTITYSTADRLKSQIIQFGAILDRGQSYNPTSGTFYADRMAAAKTKIEELVTSSKASAIPSSLQDMEGEWELVLTTVPHGIFRSSPFFLAIQEAYATVGEIDKANLFFKLHELQTCSWGISKIGRVAQQINAAEGVLSSEFDTALFSLTTVPILGWGKLLPTFGGCVVTVSNASMHASEPGVLNLEVDYTTAKPVDGLSGLGEFIWNKKVPVGRIWKYLPWNKGRSATCKLYCRYVDGEMRIMEDIDGEYFVYVRPVCPRI
jgi:hypothetical protein